MSSTRRRPAPRRQFKRVSGRDVGKVAQPVWRCKTCGAHNDKKDGCYACGPLTELEFFDSKGEANRYAELLLLQRAGEIEDLRRQVRVALHAPKRINGTLTTIKVGDYIPDFAYICAGELVWEDFKGGLTDLASWKIRHVKAEYDIDVKLTGA